MGFLKGAREGKYEGDVVVLAGWGHDREGACGGKDGVGGYSTC